MSYKFKKKSLVLFIFNIWIIIRIFFIIIILQGVCIYSIIFFCFSFRTTLSFCSYFTLIFIFLWFFFSQSFSSRYYFSLSSESESSSRMIFFCSRQRLWSCNNKKQKFCYNFTKRIQKTSFCFLFFFLLQLHSRI